MYTRFTIDKQYAKKCIQGNKHNHVSATYYLLLKEILKKGEKSIADVRDPEYNPNIFINTAKSIRKERLNAKLENASICFEAEGDEENESSAINTKKNSTMDEDEKLVR